MSIDNLRLWYARADTIDRQEGQLAYPRYNAVMRALSQRFDFPLPLVTAAFVSLSPNNDYMSNLRSVVTVLYAIRQGHTIDQCQVSTYRHCLTRAWAYVTGEADFEDRTKGPKVMSFYRNILDPSDPSWVTVDGHIHACWQDKHLTMKDAVIGSSRRYFEIVTSVQLMAHEVGMVPNALQAALWFARKRTLGILFNPQGDVFYEADDRWRTLVDVAQMPPYPPRGHLGSAGRAPRVPVLQEMGAGLWDLQPQDPSLVSRGR